MVFSIAFDLFVVAAVAAVMLTGAAVLFNREG
jgi:hypothetical protein